MKREKRRLKLAQRQSLLAQVSQRAAMRALADAVSEEGRSESLAARSRDLAHRYSAADQSGDAATLVQKGAFTAALAGLANDAEQSRADAAQQAKWQAEALGKAQIKAVRQEERLIQARADLDAIKARWDLDLATGSGAGLARILHNDESDTAAPGDKAPTRKSR